MPFPWSWVLWKARRSMLLGSNILGSRRRGRCESPLLGLIEEDALWYSCTPIFFNGLRVLDLSPSSHMIPPCDFLYSMIQ